MLNTLNAGSIISEQFVTIQDYSASLIVCFCNPAETECGMTVSLSAGIPRERFKARLWRFKHGNRKPQKTSPNLLAERLLEKSYARTRSGPK